ncbi:MAG: hypothetical protein HDS14_05845 [Bacteroides sp.]|nr:hypothetical protein [Bacteroides sp.]
MKKLTYLFVACMVSLVVASCGGGSNSSEADRIAQLEDSIAKLNSNEVSDGNGTDGNNFSTTYKAIDKHGTTFYFVLNEDKSAKATAKGMNGTVYGSWEDLSNINRGICIELSDYIPNIYYEAGTQEFHSVYIKDGWLYAKGDYAKANNPQWRIKIEKTQEKVKFPNATPSKHTSIEGSYRWQGYYNGHLVEFAFLIKDGEVVTANWKTGGTMGMLSGKINNGEFYGETTSVSGNWVKIDLRSGKGKMDWLGEGEKDITFTKTN